MRLSELHNKEIINIDTGENLGILGACDFQIDEKTGKINSLLTGSINRFSLFRDTGKKEILWKCIKKIGNDMIIVENE